MDTYDHVYKFKKTKLLFSKVTLAVTNDAQYIILDPMSIFPIPFLFR